MNLETYSSIIGKRLDELTESEKEFMQEKYYVTDGSTFFVRESFLEQDLKLVIVGGSGKIFAIGETPIDCKQQINQLFPDEEYPYNSNSLKKQKYDFFQCYFSSKKFLFNLN